MIDTRLVQQQQLVRGLTSTQEHFRRALKLLQIFQYGPPYAMETELGEALATAVQYGFTGVVVKALDGVDWMARFDPTRDALDSIDAVAAQAAKAHSLGLYYFCWTNPRHDVDMTLEVSLTASTARACDGLFLDTEPYRQFWGAGSPPGLAEAFMGSLRQQAPDAFLGLQPDPRPAALQQIRVDEWLPFVDVLAGQHYWTDFGSDARKELEYAMQLGRSAGLPLLPTLPGNANARTIPLDVVEQFPGFIVWRLGTTGPDVLNTIGGCPVIGLASPRLAAL